MTEEGEGECKPSPFLINRDDQDGTQEKKCTSGITVDRRRDLV